jgi:hypothetical protein
MAPAFVQACVNTNTGIATATATFGSNVTAGNLLVVLACSTQATTPASSFSLSDTLANKWNPVWPTPQNPSGGSIAKFIQGWWTINTTTGADTVTNVTNQTLFGTNILYAAEFSLGFSLAGVDQMLAAAGAGSSSVDPLSFTTTRNNEIVFVFGFTNPTISWSGVTVNSPFVFAASTGAFDGFCAYAIAPTAGAYGFGGTYTGSGSGANTNASAGFSIGPATIPGTAQGPSLMQFGLGM